MSATPGIPWIATNMDWTIPVARGIAPGNGTLVSAVHTAVGRFPVVAGKPETPIFEEAKRRFGAERPLVVGDRLDTDILGANRAGMASAVVLTGIDRAKQVLAADAASRPDFILGDLRGLHEPYPVVESARGGAVRVGDARVRDRRSPRRDRVRGRRRARPAASRLRGDLAVGHRDPRARRAVRALRLRHARRHRFGVPVVRSG